MEPLGQAPRGQIQMLTNQSSKNLAWSSWFLLCFHLSTHCFLFLACFLQEFLRNWKGGLLTLLLGRGGGCKCPTNFGGVTQKKGGNSWREFRCYKTAPPPQWGQLRAGNIPNCQATAGTVGWKTLLRPLQPPRCSSRLRSGRAVSRRRHGTCPPSPGRCHVRLSSAADRDVGQPERNVSKKTFQPTAAGCYGNRSWHWRVETNSRAGVCGITRCTWPNRRKTGVLARGRLFVFLLIATL